MTRPSPSLHALGTKPTTAEVDEIVHGLIDQHFAGEMSEEQTRREISGALYASGIHEEVARGVSGLSQQVRSDLADKLLILITDKMVNGGNFYNLTAGRKGSACGWARQFAKSAIISELRNAGRAVNRHGTPLDPTGHEFSVIGQTASSLIVWDDENIAHVDGHVGKVVEEYTEMTKGMRDTDRMKVNADALVLGLGVAPAVRPEVMADRDFILRSLKKNPDLAHRSLREWRDIVSGTAAPSGAVIDERITALWDDQDATTADVLLDSAEEVANALALAAVSPLPRPAKKALQRLKTVVAVGDGTRNKQWRELASALVDSYVASEFEAVSQYATMSTDARTAAITGHTIARGRLDALLDRAASFPTAPMGKTRRQVLSRIGQMAEAVFADEPSKNSLRERITKVA